MVAAQRQLNHILHGELRLILYTSTSPFTPTLVRYHGLHHATNGQNARLPVTASLHTYLRGIDDRGEGRNAIHAQIADGHAARLE